eukprot:Clim_evm10s100 gene=Clim_evmTU10s100
MNIKIAVLTAGAALFSVVSSTPLSSPKMVRDVILNTPGIFKNDAARQQFLAGENDDLFETNLLLLEQTTFGVGGCTTAKKATNPCATCMVFSLEGENNEVVFNNEIKIGGEFTIAGKTTALRYKVPTHGISLDDYDWCPGGGGNLDGDMEFSISLGEEQKDPTFKVTKDFHDSLWAFQINETAFWYGTRIFWYRLGEPKLLPDNKNYLWCGFFAQPKC